MSNQEMENMTTFFTRSPVTQQREVSNSSDCDQVDGSARLFFAIAYSFLFLVGLLLNSLIVKFFFCRAQQKPSSSTEIYLKNLVAADFLLCLSLPIRIVNHCSSSFTIRSLNCNFGASILILNMYASIMFMGYIAAIRYLKVVHPLGTHALQKVCVAHTLSAVTWVFLLMVTTTYVILSFSTQEPLTSVPVGCEHLQSSQLILLYKIINTFATTMFLAVLVSLVFFYYSTSCKVSLAQQRQTASSVSTTLTKSRRNILVLVGVFCLCFVPYHLVRLPNAFLWSCSWSFYILEASVFMSVLNVCLDPIIYFILSKRFRTYLRLGVLCPNP